MKKEEWFPKKLDDLRRRFEAGHGPSLLDAAELCVANCWAQPQWISEAMLEVVTGTRSLVAKGRGNDLDRTEDRRAFMRWSWASVYLRNKRLLPGYGHPATRAGAFAYASELLRGSDAQAEPATVENSYDKVQRAIKGGKADIYFAAANARLPQTAPGK